MTNTRPTTAPARRPARRPVGRKANRAASPHRAWESYFRHRCTYYGIEPVIESFTREELLARYGNRCFYCATGDFEVLDHFVPIAAGGPHTLANARPSCRECNIHKIGPDMILINAYRGKKVSRSEATGLVGCLYGLCGRCAVQYGWGCLLGFGLSYPPCEHCAALVDEYGGKRRPNGWRELAFWVTAPGWSKVVMARNSAPADVTTPGFDGPEDWDREDRSRLPHADEGEWPRDESGH